MRWLRPEVTYALSCVISIPEERPQTDTLKGAGTKAKGFVAAHPRLLTSDKVWIPTKYSALQAKTLLIFGFTISYVAFQIYEPSRRPRYTFVFGIL